METQQNNSSQNDASQNEEQRNNTSQKDNKKNKIIGIIVLLIAIVFLVNLCSGSGYDPSNAPFGDEENLAYHMKYCDKNIGYACNQVGIKYVTNHDINNAKIYYEKACNLEFGVGCQNLGSIYLNNNDKTKAAEYYKKACDYSNYDEGEACYDFGTLLSSKDKSEAFEYYKKACKKQYGEGCYILGLSYAAGEGVVKNMGIAKDYFREGCKYGHKLSCAELR